MPVSSKTRKLSSKNANSKSVSIRVSVERHLRMTEAAQILGVSRPTLYRLLPRIRHRRIPAGGLTKTLILIPESALEAFLAQYDKLPGGNDV